MKRIGLGTAAIGRPQYINIRQDDGQQTSDLGLFRKSGLELLEFAYMSGISYFDTAPGYGMAEELLIEWLGTFAPEGIEIATKWGYTYTANFDPSATVHEVKEHSLSKLNEQWEVSKALLPWVKTLQIHSATFESGVLDNKEVLERLGELKKEHELAIGITVSGANQTAVLEHALEIKIAGQALFDAFQVTYNILDQSVAQLTELRNRRVIIKEALANGRLFRNENFSNHAGLYNALEELAAKYEVGVDAIALRFCIDSVDPFIVLSGASTKEQLTQNLLAETFKLSDSDVEMLSEFRMAEEDYWSERKSLAWN